MCNRENRQVIRSSYFVNDVLEYATGICIRDEYAFICSRYFGIEVVDISDLSAPQFITCISGDGSEYQDCFVDGVYLYVGVYYDKRVDIYDISKLNNPQKCAQIHLDGSGQGVCVVDGILYAATALDAPDSRTILDFGKGSGNGLEIYDVTDPNMPVHLSTVKTDGRLSINTQDVWDVTVDNNYAYLSDMFGGLYVYDVEDPSNPQRTAVYQIVADQNSGSFVEYDMEKYIFPYDASKETHGCVYHTFVDKGKLYITTSNMGVFEVECENATGEVNYVAYSGSYSDEAAEIPYVRNYDSKLYKNAECVWAVDFNDNYYYLANGEAGITILDKQLNEVSNYDTEYSVKDVLVYNSYLYAAESEGGIGIYKIEDSEIIPVSRYKVNASRDCASQLGISDDGNFLIVEASISSYLLIDVSDPTAPTVAMQAANDIGLMYYRTIVDGLVAGKYFGIVGSNYEYWYQSNNGVIELVNRLPNKFYNKACGFCAVGDKCLLIANNGYRYFDPITGNTSERIKIEGITFEGKCSSNGSIMVISREYDGTVQIVNVSNIDSPGLMASFSIDGNPDIAAYDGETILIPCRYYGLLVLNKS